MTAYKHACAIVHKLAGAISFGLFALLAAAATPALAQTGELPQFIDGRDPPARVGRLSEVQGQVWLYHPEEGEWISALRNRPLTTGDSLSTEAGSRLELRVGSTALRLDGDTDIEIDRLDDEAIQIRLLKGSLAARVRSDEAARSLLLSTEDGDFSVLSSGSYRIDLRESASEITVLAGQARYQGPGSALTIYQGQRTAFWIDANRQAQYSLGQPRLDAFSSWTSELDRFADGGASTRYVSPEMTGVEDLDRYGRWNQDPEYGALWTPNQLPANWAPYSTGHWAWVTPWGWSWVDDAAWGFAPFHYGRWVVVRDRWSWAPGQYVARPVYSPALVGWIGGAGASFSVTIGGGPGVGWFPLAPHEPWVPSYRISRNYMRNVNLPSFRHRNEVDRLIQTPSALHGIEYRNRKFHHGTTTIPVEAFRRRGDGSNRVGVDPQWRGRPSDSRVDRLPGRAVADLPPPAWLGQRHERPGERGTRNPVREASRRGNVELPPSVQPPRETERPFVRSTDGRAEWPGRRSRGETGVVENAQRAPVFQSPVLPAAQVTPAVPPAMQREPRAERPDRADRIERGQRPERPFNRGEQREGGRGERPAAPPQMVERPQQAMPAPVLPTPPSAQPSRREQTADPESRRSRDPRETQAAPATMNERGGNVRDPRQGGRNRTEQP